MPAALRIRYSNPSTLDSGAHAVNASRCSAVCRRVEIYGKRFSTRPLSTAVDPSLPPGELRP